MENDITMILSATEHKTHATNMGTHMHAQLGHIIIDGDKTRGAPDLIQKIMQNHELVKIFSAKSQCELPIAGHINNRFVSRRIDRILIDSESKTIWILDYKTDTDKSVFHEAYVIQLREYASLIRQIYPDYTIKLRILWTHDWTVESV